MTSDEARPFKDTLCGFLMSSEQRALFLNNWNLKNQLTSVSYVLDQLRTKVSTYPDLQKYLNNENQTFLKWQDLSIYLKSGRTRPKFTNLVVVEFPESQIITEDEHELLSKMCESLNVSLTKKAIFICCESVVMEKYAHKFLSRHILRCEGEVDSPLMKAVSNGRLVDVLKELRNGANLNECRDTDKMYALHLAAENGHRDFVMALLENGAIVDIVNKNGETPLHRAARNGHNQVVSCLLEYDANVNSKCCGPISWISDEISDNYTPLHFAAKEGHKDVVETLIIFGADIDVRDVKDETPLYNAAKNGHTDVVESLVKHGADVKATHFLGWTNLHIATENGHKEVVESLLNHGADVNVKDDASWEPLHLAAEKGYKDIANCLIDYGADVNTRGHTGCRPLHVAVLSGYKDVVENLVNRGTNIDAQDDSGWTPLHYAAHHGFINLVEFILHNGAKINLEDKSGSTPLHQAVLSKNKNIVLSLLSVGAYVNARNQNLETPLHFAVFESKRDDIILALLENDANIQAKDKDGRTVEDKVKRLMRVKKIKR